MKHLLLVLLMVGCGPASFGRAYSYSDGEKEIHFRSLAKANDAAGEEADKSEQSVAVTECVNGKYVSRWWVRPRNDK